MAHDGNPEPAGRPVTGSQAMRPVLRKSWPWLVFGLLAAVVLGTRLVLNFDISAFFPQTPDLQHKVLLQQFQSGPGSRLLVIGVNGADEETLAEISDELRMALSESAVFSSIMNGEAGDESAAIPEPVASYFLLMEDLDFSEAALSQAIQDRLHDLAFGGGAAFLDLTATDPWLATIDILRRLTPVETSGDMWFASDGSVVLMAETRATAVDLAGQTAAVEAVREAFASIEATDALTLEMTGAGAFGVELQQTIRVETQKRSLLASLALLLVLFAFYRKPAYLFLAAVPIGMGFLAGLAAVSLLFDSVHGITLAFGFTLMGVAIDYPLHFFSHVEKSSGPVAIRRIWSTMRLGAISTGVAYLALVFSGSDGLAQLGVFTAVGIGIAVLVTRTWLPYLTSDTGENEAEAGHASPVALRYLPAIGLAGIALVATSQVVTDGLWDDRLTSLSPVPAERIADDIRLRSAAGTPDMRYQLFVHNPSLDALLSRGEDVDRLLANAEAEGSLDGWQSVTSILPGAATLTRRQNAIPSPDVLSSRLQTALADTPFRADAFDAFLEVAARSSSLPRLVASDFDGSPLQLWRDAHLVDMDGEWVSLVSLRNPDAEALSKQVGKWGDDVSLLDLHESSAALMSDYRNRAITTVSFAALLIIALLLYQRRQLLQVLWIALSVAAGLALTIAVVVAVQGQLTVIHLVALLLVTGLGLDYSLFLSRTESDEERAATNKAVLACAVSTTVAFAILAGSSIPVLNFLGLTVAAGSASNYLVALAGTRARV